jgi:hypothetical protein
MCVSPVGFSLLDSYMFKTHIRVGFQHINPANVRFMSLFCPMALAHQRVNTHFLGICGDNRWSN